ncbi:YqcI/YcgG family protein [Cohnella hashimotonis]|uniref:YqcI/YcgG family protein n=1 Tax=Cohnella hashimotonis TaxID=2826895 RepID=A0ABT6TL74_9BACL|nr:YqcI/YcgG family protein [Cohnella hashimotonis]MDI4647065.1 YqcI/YcgG family protein [Cohnella hashimotonis]
MSLLLQPADIENAEPAPEAWKKEAFRAFAAKMSDRKARFPCIPATQAFALGHLRYGFVARPWHPSAAGELGELVAEYGKASRRFGDYSSLIVFFDREPDEKDVLAYEAKFWDLLSEASRMDQAAWPADIPEDTGQPIWEYCFDNERYFVYCATPAHRSRQSRHFPFFMLALTPRWVLDRWHAHPARAAATAPLIRARLAAYDEAPAHPELKPYGSQGNLEYKQYFLRDDDTALTGCPFHRELKKEHAE